MEPRLTVYCSFFSDGLINKELLLPEKVGVID